jgi:hypothetical protein
MVRAAHGNLADELTDANYTVDEELPELQTIDVIDD